MHFSNPDRYGSEKKRNNQGNTGYRRIYFRYCLMCISSSMPSAVTTSEKLFKSLAFNISITTDQ